MPEIIRIQDLPAEEIAALLSKKQTEISTRQAAALQEFIEDIGGVQNALAAVELLRQLRDAA
jgi:hypothetical protein